MFPSNSGCYAYKKESLLAYHAPEPHDARRTVRPCLGAGRGERVSQSLREIRGRPRAFGIGYSRSKLNPQESRTKRPDLSYLPSGTCFTREGRFPKRLRIATGAFCFSDSGGRSLPARGSARWCSPEPLHRATVQPPNRAEAPWFRGTALQIAHWSYVRPFPPSPQAPPMLGRT
jgi:hypothetical protein